MKPQPSLITRIDRSGWPLLFARLVLGVVFVVFAAVKIGDPINFLKLMRQYHLMDEQQHYVLMNLIAVSVPWLEMTCGVALILGVAVRAAGLVSAGMLAAFTPLILLRGLELYHAGSVSFCDVNFDCGCGAGVVFLCSKLAENVGLFILALGCVLSRSRRFCLSNLRNNRQPAPAPAMTTADCL